ncbi:alpha/beta-hydrolase [Cubamyces sp. BRFM 1775]|nr:alpha/beta-hydrolase [Cubamyces sp. BRFM 1775]
MKPMVRLVDRLRRKTRVPEPSQSPLESPNATGLEAVTQVESIPAIPADFVSDEMSTWAREAGIVLDSVDGVWWHLGGDDRGDELAQAQHSEGYVGLQFHGGGYTLGSAKDVRSGFARIPRGLVERRICSCVLSIEYTLVSNEKDGPKRSFPLQILEALSAYRHLIDTLKIPNHRIIVVGDSAGAHLAIALQRYLLESKCLPSPQGLLLLSPWCDLSADADRVQGLLGPKSAQDVTAPYFSPALHSPPPQWPPTMVYSGALEGFASSIAVLVSKLRDAGAEVAFYEAPHILPRYSHDFLIFATVEGAWPDEVRECWARIKAWVDALRSA